MKIEHIRTMNWEAALRGMRNPKKSWHKSDSWWCDSYTGYANDELRDIYCRLNNTACRFNNTADHDAKQVFIIGPKDHELGMKLIRAGLSDHRKFLRQIFVSMDIEAPWYWWKEFSTYKVGVTQNSTSTMHTLMERKLTADDFAWCFPRNNQHFQLLTNINEAIANGNFDRAIKLLPGSYIYRRTISLNYEVLRNIYHARRNHRLKEWHTFCDMIEDLPYSEFITEVEK